MESHSIDVKIVKNQIVENHTEYVMVVSFSNKSWQVQKRYRQFDALCSNLRRAAPQLALPPLPPKKFFGNMSPSFVRLRQEKLQEWLSTTLSSPHFSSMRLFRGFLEVPKHMEGDFVSQSSANVQAGRVSAGNSGGKGDVVFNEKAEKKRLKKIVSRTINVMVDVSGAAIPPIGVSDKSSEDVRKDDILDALQGVTAQQVSAAKQFQSAFKQLMMDRASNETKVEGRRNKEKTIKYAKADELKELGEQVIVQFT